MRKLTASYCNQIGKACVCANLRKTTRLVSQIYDEYLRPSGLKATQFSLLMTLQGFGEITVKQIAERAVMDRTTVTRNVRALEKQTLVEVSTGADQRERVVMITQAGTEALEAALPLWKKAQEHVNGALGEDRAAQIVNELTDAVSALKRQRHG